MLAAFSSLIFLKFKTNDEGKKDDACEWSQSKSASSLNSLSRNIMLRYCKKQRRRGSWKKVWRNPYGISLITSLFHLKACVFFCLPLKLWRKAQFKWTSNCTAILPTRVHYPIKTTSSHRKKQKGKWHESCVVDPPSKFIWRIALRTWKNIEIERHSLPTCL